MFGSKQWTKKENGANLFQSYVFFFFLLPPYVSHAAYGGDQNIKFKLYVLVDLNFTV